MSDLGFSTWLPDWNEAACFYSKLNLQKYSKIDFSSFWHDLGFGGSLFLFKILLKKYSKIDFSSFWHDLGFGGSFFHSQFNFKKYWKFDFFQLLARSWFWRQLVSIQNSIYKNTKYVFPAFGTILVLATAFLCKKQPKNAKNTKGYLFQTQPYPWWTLYLEPPFCIRYGFFHLIRMRQDEKKTHDALCFHDFWHL